MSVPKHPLCYLYLKKVSKYQNLIDAALSKDAQ